jgi:hypothetical protein
MNERARPRLRLEIPHLTVEGPFDPQSLSRDIAARLETAIAQRGPSVDRASLAAALGASLAAGGRRIPG